MDRINNLMTKDFFKFRTKFILPNVINVRPKYIWSTFVLLSNRWGSCLPWLLCSRFGMQFFSNWFPVSAGLVQFQAKYSELLHATGTVSALHSYLIHSFVHFYHQLLHEAWRIFFEKVQNLGVILKITKLLSYWK